MGYNFHNLIQPSFAMMLALIVSTLAGGIGWWIGDFFGIAAAMMLSSLTSVIGYWYGMKWNQEYFN